MRDKVQIFREGKFGFGVSPVAQVALLLRHTGGDRDTHVASSVTSAVQNHGISYVAHLGAVIIRTFTL